MHKKPPIRRVPETEAKAIRARLAKQKPLSPLEAKVNAIASLAIKARRTQGGEPHGAQSFRTLLGAKQRMRETLRHLDPVRDAEMIDEIFREETESANKWLREAGRPELQLTKEDVGQMLL